MEADIETLERRPTDIDLYFGLSYVNYLVLHRSILQSMPLDWQYRFTELMDECSGAMGPAMKERMPQHIDVRFLARSPERVAPDCGACEGKGTFYSARFDETDNCLDCEGSGKDYGGDYEYETPEQVGIIDDPIPHYNRTRTQIDFDTGEEIRYCNFCKDRHAFSKPCPTEINEGNE